MGLIALAIAMIALAITAAPASATSTRTDYDSQVNPICASANAQAKQLYDAFEQRITALTHKSQRGRKGRRAARQVEKLYLRLPDQSLAIYDAELAQLKLVPAAPGDEALVSDWLGNRQLIQDLQRQYNEIEKRSEQLFNRSFSGSHSFRSFKRLQRRINRLDSRAAQIYRQIEPLSSKDVELGTQLGATYCVTSATGQPS